MWYGNGKRKREWKKKNEKKRGEPSHCKAILGGLHKQMSLQIQFIYGIHKYTRWKYCPHLLHWIQPKSMDGKRGMMIMIYHIQLLVAATAVAVDSFWIIFSRFWIYLKAIFFPLRRDSLNIEIHQLQVKQHNLELLNQQHKRILKIRMREIQKTRNITRRKTLIFILNLS